MEVLPAEILHAVRTAKPIITGPLVMFLYEHWRVLLRSESRGWVGRLRKAEALAEEIMSDDKTKKLSISNSLHSISTYLLYSIHIIINIIIQYSN